MALSDYNGFPGKMREAVGRQMTKAWDARTWARPRRCDACGQDEGAIHGHNEDYSTPEVYLPLCITCHLILHMRFRDPKLWEDYKLAVRSGFRGEPLEQRNGMMRLKSIYPDALYERDDLYVNNARTATVLDMICPIKFTHPNAPVPDPECPGYTHTVKARSPFDLP